MPFTKLTTIYEKKSSIQVKKLDKQLSEPKLFLFKTHAASQEISKGLKPT